MAQNPHGPLSMTTTLCKEIATFLETQRINDDSLKVLRSRDLRNGDFSLPYGKVFKSETCKGVIKEMTEEILERSSDWPTPIKEVQPTKFNTIAFFVDRPSAFKNILTRVWHYDFHHFNIRRGKVLLNNGDFADLSRASTDVSMEFLRSSIVMQHLKRLLELHGYEVEIIQYPLCEELEDILVKLNFDVANAREATPTSKSSESIHVLRRLKESKFIVPDDDIRGKKCDMSEQESRTSDRMKGSEFEFQAKNADRQCVVLDLQGFITEHNLPTGKGGLDPNLRQLVLVAEDSPTNVMEQLARIATSFQHNVAQKEENIVLLHFSSDRRCFTQQKVNLALRITQPETPVQVHLVHGQIQRRKAANLKEKQPSAKGFYSLRYEQMKQASVMKYGEEVCGSGWEHTLNQLTSGSIKFEFLNTACKSPVKLDFSACDDFGGGVDNRAGAFVMYNCARLSMLFKHFYEAVAQGRYPPLPVIEDIDFSTLREEEEWGLLFNYIFVYIDLLRETEPELAPENGEIFAKIHTHKICNFLTNLSHSLSCYYSKRHILGENRPQLLPAMYARLYLLKVLFKILQHALSLMDISVLSQL